MEPNRRSIIKAAIAAPAAAVAASVPAIAETVQVATPATPYTDYPWQWWVGHSEDRFSEVCDTLEEAIEIAKGSEMAFIIEAKQGDYSLKVDGGNILEMLQGYNDDLLDEDGEFIDYTDEQCRDLGEMVTAAIEAWVLKHKISIRAWAFVRTRNATTVPIND
jgi:hypothetical protein